MNFIFMQPKNQTKLFLFVCLVFLFLGFTLLNTTPVAPNFKTVHNSKSPTIEQIEHDIYSLPDGILKSNLLVVLGSFYDDGGGQLNELLKAFSRMRMEQIERDQKNKI